MKDHIVRLLDQDYPGDVPELLRLSDGPAPAGMQRALRELSSRRAGSRASRAIATSSRARRISSQAGFA
jgi:hypothetical protein